MAVAMAPHTRSTHQCEEVAGALPRLVEPVVAAGMLVQAGPAAIALANPQVPGVVPSLRG